MGREEASGVGHEGTDDQGTHEPCQQPPTQQSGTQIEGTATGPSATKRAWHASEACSDPKGSKRLKTQVVQPHTHFADKPICRIFHLVRIIRDLRWLPHLAPMCDMEVDENGKAERHVRDNDENHNERGPSASPAIARALIGRH